MYAYLVNEEIFEGLAEMDADVKPPPLVAPVSCLLLFLLHQLLHCTTLQNTELVKGRLSPKEN